MSRALVLAAWMFVVAVGVMVGVGGAPLAGPPSTTMVQDDPLLEALLLIDEKYVTKPQNIHYRGMVGQGFLRITNAIGRSKLKLEDTPEAWMLQCGKRSLKKTFAKDTITTVEAVYGALHEAMALGKICAEGGPVPADLVYLAIKGVVSALDSQSYLIEPVPYEQIRSESKEGVTGEIGLELEDKDGALVVADVKLGMPADGAGIRVGDRVVRIDDRQATGLSVARAEELLRGPIGSNVILAVERAGSSAPVTVTLARQAGRFQSVKYQLMNGSVGYVRIALFHGQTTEDFKTAFERLRALNMKVMVLDLRDNTGGLLNSMIGVAEYFIPRDLTIVIVKRRGDRREEHRSQANDLPFTQPLVVLINQRTASAAEILAAAFQEWGRGIVVGSKSYGKGVINAIYPLPEGYALRLTTAYYVTPSGRPINTGVTPDFAVEDKDQQLQTALDLLFKNVPALQGK